MPRSSWPRAALCRLAPARAPPPPPVVAAPGSEARLQALPTSDAASAPPGPGDLSPSPGPRGPELRCPRLRGVGRRRRRGRCSTVRGTGWWPNVGWQPRDTRRGRCTRLSLPVRRLLARGPSRLPRRHGPGDSDVGAARPRPRLVTPTGPQTRSFQVLNQSCSRAAAGCRRGVPGPGRCRLIPITNRTGRRQARGRGPVSEQHWQPEVGPT